MQSSDVARSCSARAGANAVGAVVGRPCIAAVGPRRSRRDCRYPRTRPAGGSGGAAGVARSGHRRYRIIACDFGTDRAAASQIHLRQDRRRQSPRTGCAYVPRAPQAPRRQARDPAGKALTSGRKLMVGPMLILYHSGPSVCSIKVRLTLAEKELAWEGNALDLQRGDQFQPDYLKINPNAVVPTLIHDQRTIFESTIIIEYLNDAFPAPALMPTDAFARATARHWMKKIDDYLHGDCAALRFAIAFRRLLAQKTPEELEARFAAIPNPTMRERHRDAVQHGLDAPHAIAALRSYDRFLSEMDEALTGAPYLAGERYSLADAAVTPYINRAAMLKLGELWSEQKHVAAWLARIHERPSFEQAINKFVTDHERQIFDTPADETQQKARAILREH